MRVGFVCAWEPRSREATWSGTPWALYQALAAQVEVVDIDPGLPRAARAALRLAYMRRLERGWSSTWKWSAPAESLVAARMNRLCRRSRPDVVVQMGDYGVTGPPFFIYQDVSFGFLSDHYDELSPYLWIDRATIRRRAERQRDVYRRCAGVLAMSEWMARAVAQQGEIDSERVEVVGAGTNVVPPPGWRPERRPPEQRNRLLFVGREFHRKGGDLVLRALEVLRREHGPGVSLTVAGPDRWPVDGPVPDGVRFLGRLPFSQVGRLFREHDLFVMPSRFEPLGIVLNEALAHGMPCVARCAYAMPELIEPGQNGDLVDDDDPGALAGAVTRVLADDGIYERCRDRMDAVLSVHSWDAVAGRVVQVLEGSGA